MITKTELQVKLWTSYVAESERSKKKTELEWQLKHKKLTTELQLAIDKLKNEVIKEKAELSRDRKLYKLNAKPVVVPAKGKTAETTTPPDEKMLVGLKHDLKIKSMKVKELKSTLSQRIEVLRTQFEIDYQELKSSAESDSATIKERKDVLDYYKARAENCRYDDE